MERQLISMKVKYQSLKKQNAFNREQMQRMKVQNYYDQRFIKPILNQHYMYKYIKEGIFSFKEYTYIIISRTA